MLWRSTLIPPAIPVCLRWRPRSTLQASWESGIGTIVQTGFGWIAVHRPISPAMRRWGGRPLTSAAATATVHPDDIDLLLMEAMRATSFGGRFTAECRVLHRERGLRWIETRGRTDTDEFGMSLRTRGILIDVTDDVQSDEALYSPSKKAFRTATDHIIAARKALGNAPIPRVRTALDIALMIIGDLIAGEHDMVQPELHH